MGETAINGAAQDEKRRWKRKKLHEHGHHDDIRYRGPLSYMDFQVLGWLCIVATAISLMMKLGIRVNPDMEGRLSGLKDVYSNIHVLALPFLLIANYARILNNDEGYRKQLLRNGLAMLAIFALFNGFFYHFIVGSLSLISTEPGQVLPMVMQVFRKVKHFGFTDFNIFVDLFLCTAFMFFLNYRPARLFTGKKIILFRLFAILPVAYEVGSILAKGLCAAGKIELPIWSFPLLTVKPPMTFVVFMALAVYVKTRELRYCRHGNTHEDYQSFLQTNRNSLHFSVFLTWQMILAVILDVLVLGIMMYGEAGSVEALGVFETGDVMPIGYAIGFGESLPLIFVAPFMLLFSYTREPKYKNLAIFIPVVGVVLIVFIMLQGAYQLLAVSGIPRVDFKEISDEIELFMQTMTVQ